MLEKYTERKKTLLTNFHHTHIGKGLFMRCNKTSGYDTTQPDYRSLFLV
jgi:hypothetical protein